MKYQCLKNIGIIEKFLFYCKTEYDYHSFAGKKICYLMPLTEEVPTPAKLGSDLERTEVRICSFLQTNDSEKLFSKHC